MKTLILLLVSIMQSIMADDRDSCNYGRLCDYGKLPDMDSSKVLYTVKMPSDVDCMSLYDSPYYLSSYYVEYWACSETPITSNTIISRYSTQLITDTLISDNLKINCVLFELENKIGVSELQFRIDSDTLLPTSFNAFFKAQYKCFNSLDNQGSDCCYDNHGVNDISEKYIKCKSGITPMNPDIIISGNHVVAALNDVGPIPYCNTSQYASTGNIRSNANNYYIPIATIAVVISSIIMILI